MKSLVLATAAAVLILGILFQSGLFSVNRSLVFSLSLSPSTRLCILRFSQTSRLRSLLSPCHTVNQS